MMACSDCGVNPLSMSTVNPSAAVDQSVCYCCGCGGAGNLATALNAIGRYGTILTATIQGKPVLQQGKNIAIGARGTTSVGGATSSGTLLLILLIVGVLIFIARK